MLTCFLRKSGVSTVFIRFRDSEHHAWLQPQVCRSQGIITRPFLSSFSFFTIHTFGLIIIISDFFFIAQMGGHDYNNVLQLFPKVFPITQSTMQPHIQRCISSHKWHSTVWKCGHSARGVNKRWHWIVRGSVDTVDGVNKRWRCTVCGSVGTEWAGWIIGDTSAAPTFMLEIWSCSHLYRFIWFSSSSPRVCT